MLNADLLEILNSLQARIMILLEKIRKHHVIRRLPHLKYSGSFRDSMRACTNALKLLQTTLITGSASIPFAPGYRPVPLEKADQTILRADDFIREILRLYPVIKPYFAYKPQQRLYAVAKSIKVPHEGVDELRALLLSVAKLKCLPLTQPELMSRIAALTSSEEESTLSESDEAAPQPKTLAIVRPTHAMLSSNAQLAAQAQLQPIVQKETSRVLAPAGVVSYASPTSPVLPQEPQSQAQQQPEALIEPQAILIESPVFAQERDEESPVGPAIERSQESDESDLDEWARNFRTVNDQEESPPLAKRRCF